MKRFLASLACLSLLSLPSCGPVSGGPGAPTRTAPYEAPAPMAEAAPLPPETSRDAPAPANPNAPVVKVALLLPLSGETGKLGNAMLDAAMLALYDKYTSLPAAQQTARLALLPKDTGSTPAMAEKAAKEALDEGAVMIIGPLFSSAVNAIAPMARAKGVNIVTFSNNTAIAGKGVYVLGFIPTQQVERVADYATSQGIRRVAALGPNDAYGQSVTKRFMEIVTQRGGVSKGMELYAPKPANLEAAISRLAADYTSADSTARMEALFVAEGGEQLKTILASLGPKGIDRSQLRLIGTGLWDEADIAQSPDLIGGWFASSPPETVQWFRRRFEAAYHYPPQRLAGLAYDAVALAAALTLSPAGPSFTDSMITDPRGYMGPANGLFRFKADGTSERGLAVMEVTSSGFKTLDPAPKGF